MNLPIDNKLKQPPNTSWRAVIGETMPVNQTVVFTDEDKAHIWLGSISRSDIALPILEQMTGNRAAAYWSTPLEQIEALT